MSVNSRRKRALVALFLILTPLVVILNRAFPNRGILHLPDDINKLITSDVIIVSNTSHTSLPALSPTVSPSRQHIKELNKYNYSRNGYESQDNETVYVEDIFIGIKTTNSYHSRRLDLLLETWIPQANKSVHLITDGEDEKYARIFGKERFLNTGCGASHKREDLMCKLQVAYNEFIDRKQKYKWFCTVDDDTYVIIPNLVKSLRNYDPSKPWYIGKPSLSHKYAVIERIVNKTDNRVEFWFGTGGAGICLSKALTELMVPHCLGDGFNKRGAEILNPDDTTLGYVCNHLLGVGLTVIPEFHSHIEPMWEIDPLQIHKQVTLSWGQVVASAVVPIPNNILIRNEFPQYPLKVDPTRMLTVHCYLFPETDECKVIIEKHGTAS